MIIIVITVIIVMIIIIIIVIIIIIIIIIMIIMIIMIIRKPKTELKEIDRKTRKMFTIYHSMHPQGDLDRLYWKRKEGGRGLLSVLDVFKIEENSMGFYIKDKEEKLLAEGFREGLFDDSEDPKKMKDEVVKKHKAAFEEKTLHSKFIKEQVMCVMTRIVGYGCGKATLRKKRKDCC